MQFPRIFFIAVLISGLMLSCDDNSENTKLDKSAFIELFHAFEIQEIASIELDPYELKEQGDIIYADYIIQKYLLWDSTALEALLNAYKKKKEALYIEGEIWKKTLLKAQNFQINPHWKEEVLVLEKDNNEAFLQMLEKKHPDLFKFIQLVHEGKIEESKKLNEKLKLSPISLDEWAKDHPDEVEKRTDNLYRIIMRHYFRHGMEENRY